MTDQQTPRIRTRQLHEYRRDPQNLREHNQRNVSAIEDALREVGAARSIVVDEHDIILAGNGVSEAAAAAGITSVIEVEASGRELVIVKRSGLSETEKTKLAVYDNRASELSSWNVAALRDALDKTAFVAPLWSQDELAALVSSLGNSAAPAARPSLVDQFGVPPFSVLDTRQGYWQERKRAWLALGIRSELGRGGGVWVESATGGPDDRQRAMRRASPGGNHRPAPRTVNGRIVRGDGRGRPLR